jgi:glycosyltransferase involved in cell wall biosynthesis
MKIVHLIPKADYGGAQTVVFELASSQKENGHEVSIITGTLGPIANRLAALGIVIHHLPAFTNHLSTKDAATFRKIRVLSNELRPDILHCHSTKGGLIGRVVGRRSNIPTVYTAHGLVFLPGPSIKERLQSFLAEVVAGRLYGDVVCVSKHDYQQALRFRISAKCRTHLILNGVSDTSSLRESTNHSARPSELGEPPFAENLRAVMAARFAPQKRVDLAIDAVSEVDGIELILIGDGPMAAQVHQQIANSGCTRIEVLPADSNVAEVLAGAQLSLHFSNYEGLSISMLEAMRSGSALIANDLPGVRELIDSSEPCGIITGKDVASIAAALRQALENRETIEEMGKRARTQWAISFSAKRMCAEYQALYNELTTAGRRGF